jgi:rRNA maturation RNase YbeY
MATRGSNIHFHFPDNGNYLKNRTDLKIFIDTIFKTYHYRLSKLDYVFCSDEDLYKINIEFLNHDYYTDIITFDLSENAGIIGEVYISLDRIRENHINFNTSFQNEIHRVIFHGALHLCGINDKTKKEKLKMRELENILIAQFLEKVPRGT